jgi:hypothetical protein
MEQTWINLDFSDCGHGIDNGWRVKFVELGFFTGIRLDFSTPIFRCGIVNVFGKKLWEFIGHWIKGRQ